MFQIVMSQIVMSQIVMFQIVMFQIVVYEPANNITVYIVPGTYFLLKIF